MFLVFYILVRFVLYENYFNIQIVKKDPRWLTMDLQTA